jgi:putative metalloprotease
MKFKICFFISILCLLFGFVGCKNLNQNKVTQAGAKTAQALMVTDAYLNQVTNEFIQLSDRDNQLCDNSIPAQKAYNDRMNRIIGNNLTLNNKKLDIRVYYSPVQNAFACANGSIRVYSGLMDIMSDDEIFAVIGHEVGHIANNDTKNAFRQALLTSAAIDLVGSTGKTAQKVSDSQLRLIGEAVAQAQFSQKQEYAADDYGYNFMKKNGKNPKAMASALRQLQKLFNDSSVNKNQISQLFSTHPDIANRIKRLDSK